MAQAWAWLLVRVPGACLSPSPSGRLGVTGLVGQSGLKALDSGLGVFLVSPNQAEVRVALAGGNAQTLYKDRPGDPAREPAVGWEPSAHQAGGGHLSKTAEPGQRGPQDHLLQVQRSRALRGPGLSHQPLQKGPGTFVLDLGPSSRGPGGTSSHKGGAWLPRSLGATFRTCPGGQWVCGPGECRRMGGRWRRQLRRSWGGCFRPHPQAGPHLPVLHRRGAVPASASHEAPSPHTARPVRTGPPWSRASAVTAARRLCLCPLTVWPLPAPALPQPALQLVPKSIA